MAYYPCNNHDTTEYVLWENPTPTASWGSKTITLSDSIENYKYIGILQNYSTSNSTRSGWLYTRSEDLINSFYKEGHYAFGLGFSYSNGWVYARTIWIPKDNTNQIYIGGTFRAGDSGTANSSTIPVKVSGFNCLA